MKAVYFRNDPINLGPLLEGRPMITPYMYSLIRSGHGERIPRQKMGCLIFGEFGFTRCRA